MNDVDLISAALQGNERAFVALYKKYYPQIKWYVGRFVRGEDSNDIVQITFCKAFLNLSLYDDRWQFSTWLHKIAERKCLDFLDSVHERNKFVCLDDFFSVSDDVNPENILIKKQHHSILNSIAATHPLLYQHYFEEKKYRELAAENSLSLAAVKSVLLRSKRRMREKVKHFR